MIKCAFISWRPSRHMASFQRRYDVVRCRVSTGVMHISDIYFYVTNSALSKNEAFKKSMLKRLNLKSFDIKWRHIGENIPKTKKRLLSSKLFCISKMLWGFCFVVVIFLRNRSLGPYLCQITKFAALFVLP